MPSDLIAFWRRCDLTRAPFAHPDDLPVLERDSGQYVHKEKLDFSTFVSSQWFGDFDDKRLHLSLLPAPYGGDLRNADIFVLLLNPGFGLTDYYAETCVPEFRHRLERMLTQDFDGVEFPFIWLDPAYCWHGGFLWWERKLREVIRIIAKEKFGGRYLDALRNLSRRLAHVELIPYHSPSFNAHKLIDHLPSVQAVRRFAADRLAGAARNGDITIIITRQRKAWRLPGQIPNLVAYEGGLTRGASLGPNTPGGQAILKRYGIQVPPTRCPGCGGGGGTTP